MKALLRQVRSCHHCKGLPLGPRPVVRASATARLLIIGQAPGTRVHNSGIPWNDPSGDNLRDWLGLSREQFYDDSQIAIMPMGFCYPGKGRSGDLPPRKECAPKWHEALLAQMPNIELTLLIGQYAQDYYLKESGLWHRTLTERVQHWHDYYTLESDRLTGLGKVLPLVHPSPRNRLWIKRNHWFVMEVLPSLRQAVQKITDF